MDEVEKAWKSFETAVEQTWQSAQQQREAGVDLQTQLQSFRFPIHDPEIQASSDVYFYILAALTGLLKHFPQYGKTLDTFLLEARNLHSTGALPATEKRRFDAKFAEINSARSLLVSTKIVAHVGKLQHLRKELESVNELRVTATKLRYKVEQWEMTHGNPSAHNFFSLAKGQKWLEEAKAGLDQAKPDFINAMSDFAIRFHHARREILSAFHGERLRFLSSVVFDGGEFRGDCVTFDDIDEILKCVKKKESK
jgi:hypothetical protein